MKINSKKNTVILKIVLFYTLVLLVCLLALSVYYISNYNNNTSNYNNEINTVDSVRSKIENNVSRNIDLLSSVGDSMIVSLDKFSFKRALINEKVSLLQKKDSILKVELSKIDSNLILLIDSIDRFDSIPRKDFIRIKKQIYEEK